MRRVTLTAIVAACLVMPMPSAADARVSYRRPVKPVLPTMRVARLAQAQVAAMCGEDALGCSDGVTITLGPYAARWTLEHEAGHVADAQSMSDAERAAFLELMPLLGWPIEPDAGWLGYDDQGAYVYGAAEIFADAYASCRLGRLPELRPNRHGVIVGRGDLLGHYGYEPGTNSRQRRVCARIARWVRSPR